MSAVTIIAHRGASLDAPENTLRAFSLARAQGADSMELDVQPTADNAVIVFHDWDFSRLCGAPGRVESTPLAGTRSLRVRGEEIPTLEQVLRTDDRPRDLVIELKSRRWNDVRVAALTVRVIRETKALDRGGIVISSFHPLCLMTLRRIAPEIPRAILSSPSLALPVRRLWARGIIGPRELHLHKAMITRERVAWAHRGRRRVVAWTVNDPAEARAIAECGADGIITDAPATVREAVSGVERPVP